jgi:MFS family permease
VHYARLFPGQTAADGLLILILIYTGCVVLASIVGGVISDRRGRRKILVTVSGLLMAAAALLLTFEETWTAALGAAVLFGRWPAHVVQSTILKAEGRRTARRPPRCVRALGYLGCAFATRGRDERSATARDVGGHARPFQPASGPS